MTEASRILHAIPVDELTGAISVPIYQTCTFVQEAPGVNKGFDYTRSGNPTRQALENLVAEIECGHSGYAFASGLAAIDGVLKLLSSGDEIVAVDDIYGGSFRLFTHIYEKFGVKVHYVDTTKAENVLEAINSNTRLVWIETPTNPTLKISDIAEIAGYAHAHNAHLVVDNTFASPVLQKPLTLGADIVVHSATKYLAGHSDVLAGIVVVKDEELATQIKFNQNASGGVLAPFDAWLTIRGIQTLSLRVEQQSRNAQAIAEFLQDHPVVDHVNYPGLPSHPNYKIACQQQRLFGGVVSFSLTDNTVPAAEKLVTSTDLFKLAESLGGVKSLCCHPASMTHKSTPAEVRRHAGIQDSLVRLSVGIEGVADLIEDLSQALDAVQQRQIKGVNVALEAAC